MSDETTEAAAPADAEASATNRSKHRKTLGLVLVIVSLFVWYVVADRLTPYTASARVQTYVLAIVPDVSGYVAEIPVEKFQPVEAGGTLLRLQTQRFENALQAAEARLATAGQDVGASTAAVATATANLTAAQVRLDNARIQARRLFALEERGVVPRAQGDEARAEVANAEAQVTAASAELERARAALGGEGDSNARVQLALAELNEAQLDLARATIVAPGRGLIGSLDIDEGAYAQAGQPLMSFIALDDLWIEAFMTENNLGRVKPGDEVELAFDAFPGRVYSGRIRSTAPGVSTGAQGSLAELPTAQQSRAWLRDPQRYSVIIDTTDYERGSTMKSHGLRHNGQVDVIIYTGDHWFWNALGKLWIRLASLFSYLY